MPGMLREVYFQLFLVCSTCLVHSLNRIRRSLISLCLRPTNQILVFISRDFPDPSIPSNRSISSKWFFKYLISIDAKTTPTAINRGLGIHGLQLKLQCLCDHGYCLEYQILSWGCSLGWYTTNHCISSSRSSGTLIILLIWVSSEP